MNKYTVFDCEGEKVTVMADNYEITGDFVTFYLLLESGLRSAMFQSFFRPTWFALIPDDKIKATPTPSQGSPLNETIDQ